MNGVLLSILYLRSRFFNSTRLNEFLMESDSTLSSLEHSPMKNYNEGIGKLCLFLTCGDEKFIWFLGREMRVPTVWTNRWYPTNWSWVKFFTESFWRKFSQHAFCGSCVDCCLPFLLRLASEQRRCYIISQWLQSELSAFPLSHKAPRFLVPLHFVDSHKSSINFRC